MAINSFLNCFALLFLPSTWHAKLLPFNLNLKKLGTPAEQTQVTGNIKFGLTPPPDLKEKSQALRAMLNDAHPIWLAASTHPGEEEKILETFSLLKADFPNQRLVLVPRHPERFDKVAKLCESKGLSLTRRSASLEKATGDIFLVDTMGELFYFYGAVDAAFVGGELCYGGRPQHSRAR